MAIDKAMTPRLGPDLSDSDLVTLVELEEGVEGLSQSEYELTELEDGGVEVDFDPSIDEPDLSNVPFDANLAEYMTASDRSAIASEALRLYESDKMSRQAWEQVYIKGLEILGIKQEEIRTEPFEGAFAGIHPLLGEAVVRFQAQAIKAIMPPEGPVKAKVLGKSNEMRDRQAKRVQDYMNYEITCRMSSYRVETERLLFCLGIAGSAFRKVYYDFLKNRPCAQYVPPEDVVVSYGFSDLDTADRFTHVMKRPANEVKKLQVSGFYRDVELQPAMTSAESEVRDKKDELIGVTTQDVDADPRLTILEQHADIDLASFPDPDGIARPHIVTVDKDSGELLSVYRNWREEDPAKERRDHMIHYQFVPGLGFYGLGLAHLVGGLARGATSLFRQLVDAGTLANFPGGLKARGIRWEGDDTPIAPGEWKDVDVPSGTIRDNVFPLPYKEPSPTLYQLMTNLVEDGRRFASTADLKVADMSSAEAPVGTMLAILERNLLVQSSVQNRLHDSLRKEFKVLAEVIRDYTEPAYPYEVDEDEQIKVSDFDDRVDIIPMSDPNAATMAQRVMQYQAALQLSSQTPQIYDLPVLHRRMMHVLGLSDAEDIVPAVGEIPPADPVSENMSMMNLRPVRAYEHQDHDAHLRVHMALAQDPMIAQQAQNTPAGGQVVAAIDAHVREHLAFQYRRQIEQELGAPLPPVGQPIPADIEQRISTMAADAADQLLGKKQALAQAEENAKMQADPVVQQKERELDLREGDLARKVAADQRKSEMEKARLVLDVATDMEEIRSRERIAEQQRTSDEIVEGMRTSVDAAKTMAAQNNKKNQNQE